MAESSTYPLTPDLTWIPDGYRLLANHAGMVSDSRKLLSFDSRFEMFRRSLANVVGRQVDRGQIPYDVAADLVSHVAYDRPAEIYGF